jgi:hypothetical protein
MELLPTIAEVVGEDPAHPMRVEKLVAKATDMRNGKARRLPMKWGNALGLFVF